MQFKDLLVSKRAETSYTSAALARKTDISASMLWQWEHGNNVPKYKRVESSGLLEVLRITPTECKDALKESLQDKKVYFEYTKSDIEFVITMFDALKKDSFTIEEIVSLVKIVKRVPTEK